MNRLRDDPALIKAAVEELLRYNGPLETATERYTREDTTVTGVTVPRGELVLAVLASANRDERGQARPWTGIESPRWRLALGFIIASALR